jgi:hypothetical protein
VVEVGRQLIVDAPPDLVLIPLLKELLQSIFVDAFVGRGDLVELVGQLSPFAIQFYVFFLALILALAFIFVHFVAPVGH